MSSKDPRADFEELCIDCQYAKDVSGPAMIGTITELKKTDEIKVEWPRMHTVILVIPVEGFE